MCVCPRAYVHILWCCAAVSVSGPFPCACLLSSLLPSLVPFLPLAPCSYKTNRWDINYIVVSNRLRQLTVQEGLSGVSRAHMALIQIPQPLKHLKIICWQASRERKTGRQRERGREREQRQLTLKDYLFVALVNFCGKFIKFFKSAGLCLPNFELMRKTQKRYRCQLGTLLKVTLAACLPSFIVLETFYSPHSSSAVSLFNAENWRKNREMP